MNYYLCYTESNTECYTLRYNKKALIVDKQHINAFCVVAPPGLEPESIVPETIILSLELWGQLL